MTYLGYIYDFRHRILKIGLPALISRGTLAAWGIVNIFIIRALPEEAYAVFAIARSLELFAILLGGGFFYQAFLKLVAEGDTDREKQLANSSILLVLVFAGFSALLLIMSEGLVQSFYSSIDLSGIPLILAGVVFSGALCGLPRSLMLTVHRTKDVMVSDLVQFLVRSGIVVALILSGTLRTAHQIFTAMICANLTALLVSGWLARDLFFPGAGFSFLTISEVMRFAIVTLGTTLANFVYSKTDILMLGKLAPNDVAAYGASRSLAGMMLLVLQAANMVLLPMLSRMWKRGQRTAVMTRVWSTVLLAEALMAPVVVLYVFFPRQLIDFIYSGKYSEGWPIILVLGVLSIIRPLGSFFSTASAAVGKPQYSLYSVLISAMLNVGLNLLLIPRLGGLGAAFATTTAFSMGALWVVLASIRYIRANS